MLFCKHQVAAHAANSRFLYRIGVKLYGVVCAQLQASHYAPALIIDLRVVEPKVRASTLGSLQRREGKNASEQCEIAYRESALKLLASCLI